MISPRRTGRSAGPGATQPGGFRVPRPPLGYLGGNRLNLGDACLYEAAVRLLGPLEPFRPAGPFRIASRLRLPGAGRVRWRGVVLGGGTLLNDYSLARCRTAMRLGLPLHSLGTGAGSGGHNMPGVVDLSGWRPILPHFANLGVRGPLSLRMVEELGASQAEIVGDAALAFAHERPVVPRPAVKRFGVNLVRPFKFADYDEERLIEAGRACEELVRRGWEPVAVPMVDEDVGTLERSLPASVLRRLNRVETPASPAEVFRRVQDCTVMISMRLHGAVLASCVGTPPVIVSYGDKCRDFAESMDLAPFVTPIHTLRAADVLDRVLEIDAAGETLRATIAGRAYAYRRRLEAYAARLPGRRDLAASDER
ncbi:polysaccharide pyruvyl transferase family protein [Alienimonas californiensis]|uniref:Polysaccharide pyruvyl transferase n=1 Tax=Alienimonas californiensis TaxID=2527989 RepID=A0A517P7Y1_9PLAN|nr:polysaccharide pyruvyl transferase family protein [Alienimonas californiensis]QDT15488.1 Polysaccharide pyruvyl transferase [Alienimonas californiensis]